MIKCDIAYTKDIKKNGCSFFYSPAYQLGKNIERNEEKYKISYEAKWLGIEVYAQQVIYKASWFNPTKLGDKIKIAVVDYDIDNDRMIYKVSEDVKHDSDAFRLDLSIVKALRESDLIQIKTIERDVRHKAWITYTISKLKLQESLYRTEPGVFGESLIISKDVFKRVVGSLVKKQKRGKKHG